MSELPDHDPQQSLPAAAEAARRPLRVTGALPQLLLAVTVALVSVGIRLAVDPWLGNRVPFTPSFAAVAIAAWFAGWRSGVIAGVVCYLLSNYFFTVPRNELSFSPDEVVGAGTFFLITAVIVYLAHRATRADEALWGLALRVRELERRKTDFLGALGHQLRQPLTAIRTGAHLLQGGALKPADEQSTRDMLARQVARLTLLADDLQDAARIEQGRIELRLEDVSVVAAVGEAAAAARAFTDGQDQGIAIDIPPQVDTIRADPDRVRQMLVNLLHNASKFSPRGSRITVVAEPVAPGVAITVRDHGSGIAPDQLSAIFDWFAPAQPGRRDGLGIGLPLVRQLMALHGGSVEAHSEGSGTGAAITLLFPHGTAGAVQSVSPAPRTDLASGPAR